MATPPPGFRSVTPRIVVADPEAQVRFLKTAFDGRGRYQTGRPSEIRIGDSTVMVSPPIERDLFPAFLHIYAADADNAHRRAIEAGAVTVEEPVDTPYGDRRAMVRDPFGNIFQIAHVIGRRA